jgi:hypothetical protein
MLSLMEIYKILPNATIKHPPSFGAAIVKLEAQNFRNSNLETKDFVNLQLYLPSFILREDVRRM